MSRRQETIVAPVTQAATREGAQSKPFSAMTIALSLGGALVAIVLAVALWPKGSPPTAAQPTPQIAAVVKTATAIPASPTPVCPPIAPYIAVITAYEQSGRWGEAATSAEGALSVAGLCDIDRKTLTHYAVSSGLKELSTQAFTPRDTAGQQRMVDRYLALKQRAHDAGVSIDTPLQVAATAFASSQFGLARVAIEEAITDGSFKPETDRDITKLYISTLYGLGKWYTTADKSDPLYTEGLRWLVASDKVAVKYQTGQSEAAMLLSQLGYPDKATWPQPATTPLLT
jgi:hypothetical protein